MSVTVQRAGVDTWSPCWYVTPESHAGRALTEQAVIRAARGALLPEPVAGHRIGWNPGAGMLYAEGHPSDGGLACPDDLPAIFESLVCEMREAGVPVPEGRAADVWDSHLDGADRDGSAWAMRCDGFAGVRRLDATVDLSVSDSSTGLAILAGVAAIARDVPRVKAEIFYGLRGSVETVYFRGEGGKKVLGRWYDKGVESGVAEVGRLIRPEDQRRFVKGTRRGPEELHSGYVRGKFQKRFQALWQASKGITVGGPIVLAEKLAKAVEAGDITATQAERIAGHMVMDLVHRSSGARVSKATRNRRRRQARELGLVLGDGVLQEVEVDLHEVMTQAMDGAHWGANG